MDLCGSWYSNSQQRIEILYYNNYYWNPVVVEPTLNFQRHSNVYAPFINVKTAEKYIYGDCGGLSGK